MKKMIMLTSILTIVTIITIVVWVGSANINPLRNKDTADIVEIIIHNPAKYYIITDQEDIKTLFEELQSMKLSRKLNNNKDGFAFLIDIKFKSGETVDLSILSENIRINSRNYKSNKDYLNRIQELFNTLSEKYEDNPA
ncbi:MAG: hypothetical protein K0R15_2955 [Clostridiales bacterium]|jgi:hypothetical protein|nr:hypothetical protein [Clostridiales bacterium]